MAAYEDSIRSLMLPTKYFRRSDEYLVESEGSRFSCRAHFFRNLCSNALSPMPCCLVSGTNGETQVIRERCMERDCPLVVKH